MPRAVLVLASAACLLFAGPAHAVITAPLPLSNALEAQPLIFVAEVAEILPEKPALILTQKTALKGEPKFERIAVLMKGDAEAQKGEHPAKLFDRLEAGQQVVVFAKTRKKQTTLIIFADGTWFTVEGVEDDGKIRWALTHAEPYLRRTFKGTTAEMIEAAKAGLAGTKQPPEYDPKEEPGFGPPRPKKKSQLTPPREYDIRISVIQLPFMGLIVALAALFPAVFGGLALTMKRWMMLMSALGIISLVYSAYALRPNWMVAARLGSPAGQWLLIAGIAGAFAWRAAARYRAGQRQQAAETFQPRHYELWVALALTALGVVALVWAGRLGENLGGWPWLDLGVLTGSALATTCYFLTGRPGTPRNVSAETVALFTIAALSLAAGALEHGVTKRAGGSGQRPGDNTADAGSNYGPPALLHDGKPVWRYEMEDFGTILANPLETPTGIVVAAQLTDGLKFFGRVACIDAKTGEMKWEFDADNTLLPVMSSPALANGKIYFGEGFHKDPDCRVFCLDAKDGMKVWEFRTKSHTESSPVVVDGLVVIGAGNDGMFALNAETGKEVWHYTGANGVHVDGNPAVADGRVFCGSGFSNGHAANTIFGLDLKTGKEIWSERVEYSAYGSPLAYQGAVYFGIGNSTFSEAREPKAGKLMARNASDGKVIWDVSLPDTVLARPAADAENVYVGTKAGQLHAIGRKDGQQVWQAEMAGPVLGGVRIDFDAAGRSEVIYATGENGRMSAINPRDGLRFWDYDLKGVEGGAKTQITGSPLVVADRTPEKVTRRILIGAGVTKGRLSKPKLFLFEDEAVKK